MKSKNTFKLLFVLMCLLLCLGTHAQGASPVTIHVAEAGTLSNLISKQDKYAITNLILTGNLNGADILFIREMAGMGSYRELTEGKLSILDLSGANIVEGKESYGYFYGFVEFMGMGYKEYYIVKNTISKCMFYGCTSLTSIIIPNSVISIEEEAFYVCTGLTSVAIGNEVTSIGNNAFSGCNNLVSITIPNSVTSIGDGAFSMCTGLSEINIPNSVTSIGAAAFHYTSLTSITIPSSVISFGSVEGTAFGICENLREITVAEENPNYSSLDGVLFNKKRSTLLKYPSAKAGMTYTIPNTVKNVETEAFSSCVALSSVIIGDNVKDIGAGAFVLCTSLTSITIPNSVTSIGEGVFQYCTGLTSVTIGNSVAAIEAAAFSRCKNLTEIYNLSSVPVLCNNTAFSEVDKKKCKLYVPVGSSKAYASATGWKDFQNITEVDFSPIITVEENSISVSSSNNCIKIDSQGNITVSIYNMSGQMIFNDSVEGSVQIPLSNGTYIVKIGNEEVKVLVE